MGKILTLQNRSSHTYLRHSWGGGWDRCPNATNIENSNADIELISTALVTVPCPHDCTSSILVVESVAKM
jgi:hypothetical protein